MYSGLGQNNILNGIVLVVSVVVAICALIERHDRTKGRRRHDDDTNDKGQPNP